MIPIFRHPRTLIGVKGGSRGGQPGHGPPKTFQGEQYYSLPPPPKNEVEFAKNYDDATIFDVI